MMFNPADFPNPWRVLKQTIRQFLALQGPSLASGLAFDVLLNSIPLLFIVISVMGYLLVGSDRAVQGALSILIQLIPEAEQTITDNISMIVSKRNESGVIGFVLFFIFSTAMFRSARNALNTVLGIERRSFLMGIGVDFVMALVFSGLFGITVGLISLLAVLPLLQTGWAFTSKMLGFIFTTLLFYMLYQFCPNRRFEQRVLWTASLAGALLLEISKWVFAWYISKAHTLALLYGTLSSLLFFFLWVYYACVVFLFAGALGWAIDQEVNPKQIKTEDLARSGGAADKAE